MNDVTDGGTASTWNYCYDALDRLRAMQTATTCTITSGTETFTYDDAGNRLTAAGVSYTYDPQGSAGDLLGGLRHGQPRRRRPHQGLQRLVPDIQRRGPAHHSLQGIDLRGRRQGNHDLWR